MRKFPLELYAIRRMPRRLDDLSVGYRDLGEEERAMTFGWLGERRVDQFVARSGIDTKRVITDLTLHHPALGAVQLDTVIVTNSKILLLEVKNIHGMLELESTPARLKRTGADGTINYFACPFTQLSNAATVLSRFLTSQGMQLPVEAALILAAKNSDPKFPNDFPALFPSELPGLIRRTDNNSVLINNHEALVVVDFLRRQHSPFNPYPLAVLRGLDDLYNGSLCNFCDGHLYSGFTRKADCRRCGVPQWVPYTENLIDYFLIWGNTITRRQGEEYLGVKSTKAKSLLCSAPFIRHNTSHRTHYTLNYAAVRLNSYGKLI